MEEIPLVQNEIAESTPRNKSLKHNHKIFLLLIVLFIVIIISILNNIDSSNKLQKQIVINPTISPSSTPIPTPSGPAPSIVLLEHALQGEMIMYKNPSLPFTFSYPAYFVARESDTKNWEKSTYYPNIVIPSTNIIFNTPSIPENLRAHPQIDWVANSNNTMYVSVSVYENTEHASVYDFITKQHEKYPGNGISATFDEYKKSLQSINIPKQDSYMFEGNIGENPAKEIYFEYLGKIYLFRLGGGEGTGAGYTKEANQIFMHMLETIILK